MDLNGETINIWNVNSQFKFEGLVIKTGLTM